MSVDLERAKTDFAYFAEHCLTVNGEPFKLTPVQRKYLEFLDNLKPGDRLCVLLVRR